MTYQRLPFYSDHNQIVIRSDFISGLDGQHSNQQLISDERIQLFLSWKNSGFSVHNSTTVYPRDEVGLQTLAFYMLRAPVSLQRLRYEPHAQQVLYQVKPLQFTANQDSS